MHCPVASQTMDQRDQDAVQDRMLAGKSLAGVRRLGAVEHPSASANRRPRGLAAKCGRRDLDFWVVANPLQLPGSIPGATKARAPSTAMFTGVPTGAPLRR